MMKLSRQVPVVNNKITSGDLVVLGVATSIIILIMLGLIDLVLLCTNE